MRNFITFRFLFVLIFCFAARMAKSQGLPPRLSEQAELSLLTCAPGTEMYSMFGHSAFRVRDSQNRLDRVYNYGTFDFNDPEFLMKFVRGKLDYFLTSYGMPLFVEEYRRENRSVVEQGLNLSPGEVQAVYDYLNTNELPANRAYKYDFFFDNCATRERDVLVSVLGERLRFQPAPEGDFGTLRDLIDSYMPHLRWTDFGIDVLLGMQADKRADRQAAMFLPDYLYDGMEAAEVEHNGKWEPLVRDRRQILKLGNGNEASSAFFSPKMTFWILFLVLLVLSFMKVGQHPAFRVFDTLFFLLVGVLGTLMLLMWVATDHQATNWNLNLIWALPTHLFFAFLIWLPSKKALIYHYARITLSLGGIFLLTSWWLLPQSFNPAVYPLVLALYVRTAYHGIVAAD